MQAASLVLTSYQDSLSRSLDIVANNIANSNTTGFKREDIQFDTVLSRMDSRESLHFAVDHGTYRDTAQGPMYTTGNPFDIAIQGPGYFPVQTDQGIRYTRAGALVLNGQGELVNGAGDLILGDGDQPITFPEDAQNIHITNDGVITATSGSSSDVIQIGKLRAVTFANEQELQNVGNSLYSTNQTPESDAKSKIVQGMIEQSNVRSVNEMTTMIEIMRSYQVTVRLLDTEHKRQKDAIARLVKATA